MLATPSVVTHFAFLRDVWIRTQKTTVASRPATNLATHLPRLEQEHKGVTTHKSQLQEE